MQPFARVGIGRAPIRQGLPAQRISDPDPASRNPRLYLQARRERDEKNSSYYVGLHFAGGGDADRRVHNRQSATEFTQHQPRSSQRKRIGGAIYGHGLLEHVADHGNAAKRQLGSVYRSGSHSHKQRHGVRDGPSGLRQRSQGNLHGFCMGSGLWLHGRFVPCGHCLWRGMRPGFCNSAADLPIIPAVALRAAAREQWPPEGELFFGGRGSQKTSSSQHLSAET